MPKRKNATPASSDPASSARPDGASAGSTGSGSAGAGAAGEVSPSASSGNPFPADALPADPWPGPAPLVSDAFARDLYKTLKSYTPEQLSLAHQFTGAMLSDVYPRGAPFTGLPPLVGRRCYTLVRSFVAELIELPRSVREAVIQLSPELRDLLDRGDAGLDDGELLRRLLAASMPADEAQLDTMEPYERGREMARAVNVMRGMLGELTRPPSFWRGHP